MMVEPFDLRDIYKNHVLEEWNKFLNRIQINGKYIYQAHTRVNKAYMLFYERIHPLENLLPGN